MTNIKTIALAAALSSAIVAPALARDTAHHPAHHAHHVSGHQRSSADRSLDANASFDRNDSKFWRGDVVAGTADALAVPFFPFQNSYASNAYNGRHSGGYDNVQYGDNFYGEGYNNGHFSPTYAARNSFSCLPGSTFRGGDGYRHVCQ